MHRDTENIYKQKVNQIIDYINANLCLPLSLESLANHINVSQRQLLRIMRTSLDESLYSYVTRQRTERAVLYLQTRQMTLAQVAGMVGYDNPQSFSRAFKKQFGVSPKVYMDRWQTKLHGSVNSSGNRQNQLRAEICEENDLELVYIRIFGKYGEDKLYEIGWSKLIGFLKEKEALTKTTRYIGISFDDPNITKPEQCRFYACATVDKKIRPMGEIGTIRIKQGKYAVYTLKGGYSGLQDLYNNISINFDKTLRQGMAFEEYVTHPQKNNENTITKIFIPIK